MVPWGLMAPYGVGTGSCRSCVSLRGRGAQATSGEPQRPEGFGERLAKAIKACYCTQSPYSHLIEATDEVSCKEKMIDHQRGPHSGSRNNNFSSLLDLCGISAQEYNSLSYHSSFSLFWMWTGHTIPLLSLWQHMDTWVGEEEKLAELGKLGNFGRENLGKNLISYQNNKMAI